MNKLPKNLKPGGIVEIHGVPLVFDRCDPDRHLTLRDDAGIEFRIVDQETGERKKPHIDEFLRLMADGHAVIRSDPFDDHIRARARAAELDARAAKVKDPKAQARAGFARHYDANPAGLSDRALRAWRDLVTSNDDKLAEVLDGWKPSPQTLRSWIRKRGRPGDRRMRDFVDMRGKVRRRRKLDPVVLEIMQRHALSAWTSKSSVVRARYSRFANELDKVNRGLPTGADLPDYEQPAVPYRIPTYQTFRREVRKVECSETWRAKHGDQAVYSRWRGGGRSRMPTKVGALAVQDDTRLPAVFLVDVERGVPIGEPLFTIQMDCFTRCITGWDLSYDEPSTATTLRTVLHAGTPKVIPTDMAQRYPTLAGIACCSDALLLDNAVPHHSHGTEDSLADIGTMCIFAGSEMPRDKALGERAILTIIQIFLSALPGTTYDIPRAREFGYDPEKHAMLTVEEANALLTWAICVYHVTRSRALMDRQPALVWAQQVAQHGVNLIQDADEFARAIGDVEYDLTLTKSGITVNNLRYSAFQLTPQLLDDLVGLEPPSKRRTKNPTVKVKVRIDTANVGHVHVWNRRTSRYVTLPCDNPEYAEGLPLWLHRRIRDFAKDEALAFNTLEEQAAARADYIERVMEIAPTFGQREKRLVARLMGVPQVRRLLGEVVEVDDESVGDFTGAPSIEEVEGVLPQDLAAPFRKDAETRAPRPAVDAKPVGRRGGRRVSSEVRDRRDAPHGKKRQDTSSQPAKRRSTGGTGWGSTFS